MIKILHPNNQGVISDNKLNYIGFSFFLNNGRTFFLFWQ